MSDAGRSDRRAHGAWYTPEPLVAFLVDVAAQLGPAPRRILDPSCGDGRVLAACAARWPDAELHGWELDPATAADTQARMPRAKIRTCDALSEHPDPSAPFDLVIGNPPFLGQLRGETVQSAARALALRRRFGASIGAYTDVAAMFLLLAAELSERVVLVQPVSTFAARDTARIRRLLAPRVGALWVSGGRLFVGTPVVVGVVGLSAQPTRLTRWHGADFVALPDASPPLPDSWTAALPEAFGGALPKVETRGTLGDIARAVGDFRDEYYRLQGRVREHQHGDYPLIVSGLIDPGVCLWGKRPARIHKQVWQRPGLAPSDDPLLGKWISQRAVPKALIAMQTPRIEAFADTKGSMLPVTPVVSVIPHDPADLPRVLALLLSPWATAWARTEFSGTGLSATAMRISASGILRLPMPVAQAPQPLMGKPSGSP